MTELIPIALLALCLTLAALRVPAALKGQNRATLATFLLISVVLALAIPAVYLPVDEVLGGVNAANLISRLTLNVAFILVGLRVADALACKPVRDVITGAWGRRVFLGTSLAMIVMFWVADVPVSSMGLNSYADQSWVELYRLASRLYPAFIAMLLVPWTFKAALDSSALPVLRVASTLFATGFALVSVLPALLLTDIWINVEVAVDATVYTALMLVALAPTITWASKRHYAKKEKALITTSH